ncbi:hypothetical protein, partial [Sinorhizobium meliloti]|uniref:hypothetical protein n=1 Tax=Rhizobium meliloti TaxID=382 RepID=UPI001AECA514
IREISREYIDDLLVLCTLNRKRGGYQVLFPQRGKQALECLSVARVGAPVFEAMFKKTIDIDFA